MATECNGRFIFIKKMTMFHNDCKFVTSLGYSALAGGCMGDFYTLLTGEYRNRSIMLLPTTKNSCMLSERGFISTSVVIQTETTFCNGRVGVDGDVQLDSDASRI